MPSTASPFGLKPIYHPSGRIPQEVATIATGYATNIFQYAPVKILAGTNGLALAAAGERAVGVFLGVEYTDSTGMHRVLNYWPASTAGTNIVAYFTRDPGIRYEIQMDGAMPSGKGLGVEMDWGTATEGSTTTGLSSMSAAVASIAPQNNAGLRLVDYGREVNNAIGDTYTNIVVEISEHQDVADRIGYGSTT